MGSSSKTSSFEEKIKLPVAETISRFYQPKRNRKAIKTVTVAVYVLLVSLAAIMLSLYYVFLWDPTIKPFVPRVNNCDKIIIPEHIAIRLINSTEMSANQFYKNIFRYYRTIHREDAMNYGREKLRSTVKNKNSAMKRTQKLLNKRTSKNLINNSLKFTLSSNFLKNYNKHRKTEHQQVQNKNLRRKNIFASDDEDISDGSGMNYNRSSAETDTSEEENFSDK